MPRNYWMLNLISGFEGAVASPGGLQALAPPPPLLSCTFHVFTKRVPIMSQTPGLRRPGTGDTGVMGWKSAGRGAKHISPDP